MRDVVKDEGEPEREEAPNPLQSIDTFESIHKSLLRIARSVASRPSIEGLKNLEERLMSAVSTATTLYYYDFFKDSDNDALVEAALRTMMTATEEIVTFLKEMQPEYLCDDGYEDDAIQTIVENVMNGSGEEVEVQVVDIFNNYTAMVSGLKDAVIGCLTVRDYVKKEAKKRIRLRAAGRFGSTATASFVGFILAHKFQARKKA